MGGPRNQSPVECICGWCRVKFNITPRYYRILTKRRNYGTPLFCSKKCANKWLTWANDVMKYGARKNA